MKKQRIIAAIIASALIATATMTASAYADNSNGTMLSMDNPFSGVVEKQSDGTWKITDRGAKLIKLGASSTDADFYIHISLKEKSETFTANFTLRIDGKDYSHLEEMMKLEGRKELYIPVSSILENITENNKGVDITKVESGSIDFGGGADLVSDIEITAKDGTEETAYDTFDKGVWAAFDTDGSLSWFFVFTDSENGHTENGIGGVPFACEQKGSDIMFHMGGVDDNTPAQMFKDDKGDLYGTFDYGEESKTYKFVKVRDADPDTFDAGAILTRGVWASYIKDENGEYNKLARFFIFDDATSGSASDGTTGAGFKCEQNGEDIMFHFGSIEDETPAKVTIGDDGNIYITYNKGAENEFTQRLSLDRGADPDTFVPMPEILFDSGVWAAYDTTDDSLFGYFVFRSTEEGSIDFGPTGAPFACEQNGDMILFHLFSADDNTWGSFSYDENKDLIGKLTYDNGVEKTLKFKYVYDADWETFNAETYRPSTFTDFDGRWYVNSAEALVDANGVAGGANGISINYAQPLLNGFDVTFEFELANGQKKSFRANNTGSIDNDTIFFNLRELLSAADVSVTDITEFVVNTTAGNAVVRVDLGPSSGESAQIQFGAQAAADVDTGNPHTGVEGIFAAAAVAALAGAAAFTFRKRK